MEYLITGGAGFIGSALARKLIIFGHKVIVIDDLSTGYKENIPSACLFFQGDVSDVLSSGKLDAFHFDAIFHIAGQSSGEISFENPRRDLHSNTCATLEVLSYCQRVQCKKIIFTSTMSVYGQTHPDGRYSETSKTSPLSFYAVGKLASENYLKIYQNQFGINYTIFRLFNVYGEGQDFSNLKQGMVSIYLKQFLDPSFDEVIVKGKLDRFRDFVHVSDVVDIFIQSAIDENFLNQICNVGAGVKTTVANLLSVIRKNLGSSKPVRNDEGTLGDQFGCYAITDKLQCLYKKPMVSLELGLKDLINSLKHSLPIDLI